MKTEDEIALIGHILGYVEPELSAFIAGYSKCQEDIQKEKGKSFENGYNAACKESIKESIELKIGFDAVITFEVYTFEQFWNDYDKKVGKEKAESKFNKLSEKIKVQIRDYLPKYKEAQPDKQYRKNPETFINQKTWNDEIIYGNKPKQSDSANKLKQSLIAKSAALGFGNS